MSILIQVHIPDFDVQGDLKEREKLNIVETCLEYHKLKNPNTRIYLSGHGKCPSEEILSKTITDIYWENQCRPLISNGWVKNMPAQYPFVSKGLDLIKDPKELVVKTRGDGVIGLPSICSFSHNILSTYQKRILITQMTYVNCSKMGDCFMAGTQADLKKLWSEDHVPVTEDGLVHTAAWFISEFYQGSTKTWHEKLKDFCSFVDMYTIKCMDFRWIYHQIVERYKSWENFKEKLFQDQIDFREFLWGKRWFSFSENGELLNDELFSERTF